MNYSNKTTLIPALTLSLLLAACGGSSSAPATQTPAPAPAPAPIPTYTISGTVTGLSSGTQVTLVNNGANPTAVKADGSFAFSAPVASGGMYAVAVSGQPLAQTCSVTAGDGTKVTANVSNVTVTCGALTEQVLYAFGSGTDAEQPNAGLILGTDGNFYGTANYGGTNTNGAVFRITPSGVETVLYSFGLIADGVASNAALISGSDGNFYGTASSGGDTIGDGTVFKITPAGVETVLHTFGSGTDGSAPNAALVSGPDGNFYGTTTGGGAFSGGTVFSITPAGVETVIYSFASGADGSSPGSTLILGTDGKFYGTTNGGGASGNGTVFQITLAGVETVLYSFAGGADGSHPNVTLIAGADGNFYGTTLAGGTNNSGTVFMVTPAGVESVLYSFGGGTDGATPNASVLLGSDGNFYGTTTSGGASNLGTLFMVTPAGVETVLHSFAGGADGANPVASLVIGPDGHIYGTTQRGGPASQGTVFRY